jgi:hypothetical protein
MKRPPPCCGTAPGGVGIWNGGKIREWIVDPNRAPGLGPRYGFLTTLILTTAVRPVDQSAKSGSAGWARLNDLRLPGDRV